MAGLSGDDVPVSLSTQINGEHAGGLVNGDAGTSAITSGQLTSELRNLVSILGRQSDNGISLEQLLGGVSPTRTSVTPSASHQLPTTPSSSRSNNWASRKRGRPFELDDSSKRRRVAHTPYSARQSGEKGHGKGLRHFSQRVCEKVRQKGNMTYNEVADELVQELSESERKTHGSNEVPINHKNIRRRVYDALNVLMAMNIISKEKKDIRWIGLPTNSVQECQLIEEEVAQAEQRIQDKRNKVEELIVQIISYKNLMKRNRERVSSLGLPAQNTAIGLPFIIVNTNKSTTIDCSISSDKSEYVFSFDNAFELHNDIDILKKMGLDCGLHSGTCSIDSLKVAKSMLPKAFGDTLDEIVLSKHLPVAIDSPQTPVARHLPSLCSTPSTTLSPTLSPFNTPTASSPHVAAIAAVLAQAAAASSSTSIDVASAAATLLHSSPLRATSLPNNHQHQASPLHSCLPNKSSTASFTTTPDRTSLHLSGLSSPSSPLFSDTTPTNSNNATPGHGKVTVSITTKASLSSPISGAKSVLHHHCPVNQSGNTSPLVKSSMVNVSNAIQLGSPIHGSCSSLVVSKSPSSKFVTASKVSNSEHINTLLQQLQQNPNISRILSAEALQSNGNGTS